MKYGYLHGSRVIGSMNLGGTSGLDPYTSYPPTFQGDIILSDDEYLDDLEQPPWEQSDTATYTLGTRLQCGNRVWRYAHILDGLGPATLGRGRVMVPSDDGTEVGNFLGAQVAGAYTVDWTSVAAIAENQYANGYLLCQGGFVHKIRSNTAAAAPGDVITLTLYEPFAAWEAIAAGRYGLLLENPYANTTYLTVTGPSRPVGVMTGDYRSDLTDANVWLQTWGPCGVIAQPATLGDTMNEIAMTLGIVIQEEVTRFQGEGAAAAAGYPQVGESWIGGGAVNWDNENFMTVWLKIDP
ncbi:MAG: hypothetical protein PHZ19_08465 [Candidatus Thermoplasmatota archaeon]|nr:hypothetical protein [Candidatus Thermoplasmatota archaeon]